MILPCLFLLPIATSIAQELPSRHEIGLTLGGLLGGERVGSTAQLDLDGGVALQADYGYRLLLEGKAALYAEVHFLASPLRDISSSNPNLTRDVASAFLTPGIRLKLFPSRALAPYIAIGGGWASFEQSTTQLSGAPNPASRLVNHGVIDYGGGVDYRLWRFIGLRAEVRDFTAAVRRTIRPPSPVGNTTSSPAAAWC